MNQNDLFVTAMVEYTVAETTTNSGWGSLLACVLSEFPHHDRNRAEVSSFLRTQEKLFKDAGNTLPAAYRSAKSTLLKAIEWNIPFVSTIGKSDLYNQTKLVMELSKDEETELSVFTKSLNAATKYLINARDNAATEGDKKVLRDVIESFLRALDY